MKFIIEKSNILEAVNIANKGISIRTTIPILQHYLIIAKNNEITIYSSDTEISVETKSECNVIEDGQIALEAKLFSDIIRKMPNSEIEITVDENFVATIHSSDIVFKMQGLLGDEFVAFPEVQKEKTFTFSSSKFKNMINKTRFSVGTQDFRPIIKGELLQIKDGNISLVSMDGYRISIQKDNINIQDEINTVIPVKTLIELSKILKDEEDIIIGINKQYVIFNFENTKIISRVIDGVYPNFESLFNEDYNTLINVDKKNLQDAIDRASLMANESKKNPVVFKIENNLLIIKSNTEIGQTTEKIEIKKNGENITIAFNPRFLLEALSAIEDENINIIFTSEVNPCIIKNLEKDNYKYLILPIKITED